MSQTPTDGAPSPAVCRCRLCGGESRRMFDLTLLKRHRVGFFRCDSCQSLQTEEPYWLAEAYADPRPITDVGMAARTLELSMRTDVLLSVLGVPKASVCIDWAGGNGLFTRLMRDRGWNFFRHEPYTPNFYVPFHDAAERGLTRATVITAFEALEHLPDPERDLPKIFDHEPDVVLATTEVYRGQEESWYYYAADSGQHVFFYSPQALEATGRKFGMSLISDGQLHIFLRPRPRGFAYGREEVDRVIQLLRDPQHFHALAMERFADYARQPYRHVGDDHQEIIRRIRESGADGAGGAE